MIGGEARRLLQSGVAGDTDIRHLPPLFPGALVLGEEARKVALSVFAAVVHSQYGARRTHQQRPAGLHEG